MALSADHDFRSKATLAARLLNSHLTAASSQQREPRVPTSSASHFQPEKVGRQGNLKWALQWREVFVIYR